MFKLEKVKVWQKAVDLSGNIHRLTRKFLKGKIYLLTNL
ncbi:MAG: four helix bundle protein [Candidatus Omnitrophica bacterium]|nr:four helix bundle protein [Candidatus Omnitrophota bacterium]